MKFRSLGAVLAGSVALSAGAGWATDLEVTHWWTSGGEAAAVAEFAKAFDATGNKWVDGAIAGPGDTAPGRSWSAGSPAATRWAPRSSTTAAKPRSWSRRA